LTPGILEERPVFFPCGDTYLAGILTVPSEANGRAVLIPWGAGAFPSSGRNRLRTRLARSVAEEGFHSFRFDYIGVGESDGDYVAPDLDRPNTAEIVAASEWLDNQGLSRINIVTNCFGGWSALLAAPKIPGLEGIAAVNPPVRRDHDQVRASRGSWGWWYRKIRKLTLAKLLNQERRAIYGKLIRAKATSFVASKKSNSRFTEAVEHLLNREIPLLLIYGSDGFRADFESERLRDLRQAIEDAGPLTRIVRSDVPIKGCASLAAQDLLLAEVRPWLLSQRSST
jgi:pimeloyl-ACP methyl ester carboxylesterase